MLLTLYNILSATLLANYTEWYIFYFSPISYMHSQGWKPR